MGLLCWLGIHKWGEWSRFEKLEIGLLLMVIQTRICAKCKKAGVRRIKIYG